VATAVEAAPRDPQSSGDSRELVCNSAESETMENKGTNARIEVQIGGKVEQAHDNEVNNTENI
jgi:hypothetical protein